jgi:hypothetical protein
VRFEKRTIILNNQPFQFSPAKIHQTLGWSSPDFSD